MSNASRRGFSKKRAMEINVKTVEGIIVVEIDGDIIDEKTAPQVQEQVSSLVQPDCKIILNMAKVYSYV